MLERLLTILQHNQSTPGLDNQAIALVCNGKARGLTLGSCYRQYTRAEPNLHNQRLKLNQISIGISTFGPNTGVTGQQFLGPWCSWSTPFGPAKLQVPSKAE